MKRKQILPINEALQGILTEEEKAAGAVAYDLDLRTLFNLKEQEDGSDETAVHL